MCLCAHTRGRFPHTVPRSFLMTLAFPTFTAGMVLSMSLIMAIGPQNAHVLRMGLQRQHVGLTVAVCMLSDMVLIGIGVLGLSQLGGLSDAEFLHIRGNGLAENTFEMGFQGRCADAEFLRQLLDGIALPRLSGEQLVHLLDCVHLLAGVEPRLLFACRIKEL